MIFTELACGVAEWFQQLGNCWIVGSQSDIRTGHPDLSQARADRVLAGDKCRAPGGAALLPVIIGKGRAFIADAINIGGAIPHLTTVVIADVPPADVVTPKDEDVGFACLSHCDLL